MNTELDLLSNWLMTNTLSLITHTTFFQLFHRARMKTNNYFNIMIIISLFTQNNTDNAEKIQKKNTHKTYRTW